MNSRRNSYQKGFVQEKSGRLTLRFLIRDPSARRGWREKRESLPKGTTRKEAAKMLENRMREINETQGANLVPGLILRTFVKTDWQRYLEARAVKLSTRAGYESMLKAHILPALGDKQLASITPGDISALMDKLSEAAPKHALNIYALLRLIFDLASDLSLIDKNPVRRKIHRPQTRRPEKFALTGEQVQKLLDEVPEEWRALFSVVAHTSIRAGEALGLRWCDVDLEAGILHIRHSLWRTYLQDPKTKQSVRAFALTDKLRQILVEHYSKAEYRDPEHFVFSPGGGMPSDQDMLRRQVLYPALERAGIEIRHRASGFHLLRHTAATVLVEKGRNLGAQTALGHATLTTTMDNYVHAQSVVDLETMTALERALEGRNANVITSDKVQ